MEKINFVWFDLGYTLVYLEREKPYLQLLKHYGYDISLQEIEKAFHLTDKYFMREHLGFFNAGPEVYMNSYLEKLNQFLQLPKEITYATMRRIYEELNIDNPTWRIFELTIRSLAKLQQHGLGIGLISNWDKSARKVLEKNNLLQYFDEIIISSEVDVVKPEKEIFELALSRTNLKSAECIYIGDNYYDDIVGCQKMGIRGCLINRFGSLGIEELNYQSYLNTYEIVNKLVS